MNGASVSTVLQRSEPKWQNTCAVEYLNDCQLLVTVGKKKKKPSSCFRLHFLMIVKQANQWATQRNPEQKDLVNLSGFSSRRNLLSDSLKVYHGVLVLFCLKFDLWTGAESHV